jgi:hypothetical protein
MKLKSLFWLSLVVVFFSSCGINELEDRLDKVENALGTNEPLDIDFQTKNLEDLDISKKASFLFKSKGYNEYIEDNQDGTYDVYIERYYDVFGNEGAWIFFEYNLSTKEITNKQARVYFYDRFGRYINPIFSDDAASGNTLTLDVKSINVETGVVDVNVTASTIETSTNNEYSGKPMNCTFSFKGKLDVFID